MLVAAPLAAIVSASGRHVWTQVHQACNSSKDQTCGLNRQAWYLAQLLNHVSNSQGIPSLGGAAVIPLLALQHYAPARLLPAGIIITSLHLCHDKS